MVYVYTWQEDPVARSVPGFLTQCLDHLHLGQGEHGSAFIRVAGKLTILV